MTDQEFQQQLAAELTAARYAEIKAWPNREARNIALAALMNAPLPVVVESDPITMVAKLPDSVTDLMAIIPGSELGPMATATWREASAAAYAIDEASTKIVNAYIINHNPNGLYLDQAAAVVIASKNVELIGAFLNVVEAADFISAQTKTTITDSFMVPDPSWEPETWTFPDPSVATANGWRVVSPADVDQALT